MKFAILAFAILALESSAGAGSPAAETYDEAHAAFERADYAVAIAKWQTLYRLTAESSLLFDIAQAQRLHGDCREALSNYRRFVDRNPQDEHRRLAEDFIRELDPTCVSPKRDVVNGSSSNRGQAAKLVGIVTGSAGVVLLATGAGLGHHASTLGDEVTTACSVSCPWSVESSKDAAGRRDAALGWTLGVVGAVAIVGGVSVYFIGVRQGSAKPPQVDVQPHGDGAVLSWSGSW
jgi:hypothetical protein